MRWPLLIALLSLPGGCVDRSLRFEGPGQSPVGGGGDLGGTSSKSYDMATSGAPADLGHGDEPDAASPSDGGGGGQLAAPVTLSLPAGYEGESVAIGDVTGDGRADVVVAGWTTNADAEGAVFVYAQTAAGTLAAPVQTTTGQSGLLEPATVAIGDVNGAARLDVLIPLRDDLGLFLQNAAGGLEPMQTLAATQFGNGEEDVAVADLNGDGRADVVATGWASAGVDVWFQSADGSLAMPQSFACPHGGYDVLSVADLNHDGALDVVVVGGQSYDACVLLQQPGGFAPFVLDPIGNGPNGLATGDLDGDGRADVILTGDNGSKDYLGLMHQNLDGTLAALVFLPSANIPDDVALGDLNGDGRLDAIVVHTGWSELGVYRQEANGTLSSEQIYQIPYIDWGSDRMAVGDINSDGKPDIVITERNLTILYNQ
jgi:hypothetical protein